MKYQNAGEILPEPLLQELQKYAAGKLLYVPTPQKAKGWGENSGFRDKLLRRNRVIRSLYQAGKTISELAEEFYLSVDSIKKIVYGQQDILPVFSPGICSAKQYSAAGMMEEWVRLLLKTRYSADLPRDDMMVSGLVKMPLRLIRQFSLPVDAPAASPEEPLIVTFHQNIFRADYQPLLHQQLTEQRRHSCYAIIVAHQEDIPFYLASYGKLFREIDG